MDEKNENVNDCIVNMPTGDDNMQRIFNFRDDFTFDCKIEWKRLAKRKESTNKKDHMS